MPSQNDIVKSVNARFGGQEIDPEKINARENIFQKHLYVLANTTFRLSPDEPITSDEYQYQLKRFSSQLSNNRIIEYQDEHGKSISRHLTREEYDRVNLDRIQLGTGQLRSYSEVKIKDFPQVMATDQIVKATAQATESMYKPEQDFGF